MSGDPIPSPQASKPTSDNDLSHSGEPNSPVDTINLIDNFPSDTNPTDNLKIDQEIASVAADVPKIQVHHNADGTFVLTPLPGDPNDFFAMLDYLGTLANMANSEHKRIHDPVTKAIPLNLLKALGPLYQALNEMFNLQIQYDYYSRSDKNPAKHVFVRECVKKNKYIVENILIPYYPAGRRSGRKHLAGTFARDDTIRPHKQSKSYHQVTPGLAMILNNPLLLSIQRILSVGSASALANAGLFVPHDIANGRILRRKITARTFAEHYMTTDEIIPSDVTNMLDTRTNWLSSSPLDKYGIRKLPPMNVDGLYYHEMQECFVNRHAFTLFHWFHAAVTMRRQYAKILDTHGLSECPFFNLPVPMFRSMGYDMIAEQTGTSPRDLAWLELAELMMLGRLDGWGLENNKAKNPIAAFHLPFIYLEKDVKAPDGYATEPSECLPIHIASKNGFVCQLAHQYDWAVHPAGSRPIDGIPVNTLKYLFTRNVPGFMDNRPMSREQFAILLLLIKARNDINIIPAQVVVKLITLNGVKRSLDTIKYRELEEIHNKYTAVDWADVNNRNAIINKIHFRDVDSNLP